MLAEFPGRLRARDRGRLGGPLARVPPRPSGSARSGSGRRGRCRPADVLTVVIDPGRAFGTGAHPSTRLCLELLLDERRGSLLDIGCGSGVISIAAATTRVRPRGGARHRRGRRRGHARERGRERRRDREPRRSRRRHRRPPARRPRRREHLARGDRGRRHGASPPRAGSPPATSPATCPSRSRSVTPAAASSTAGQPTSSCATGRHAPHRHRGRRERVRFRAVTAGYLELVRRRPARRLLYALSVTTLSFGMLSLVVAAHRRAGDRLLSRRRLRGCRVRALRGHLRSRSRSARRSPRRAGAGSPA